ncbi:MAG TPA: molybdopterin cofactor-binding domain-containing protein [Vicinamibacteria bacterium]
MTTSAAPPPGDRFALEPERYELAAGPAYRFDVDRREFVKLLGGGLVVLVAAAAAPAQESGARGGGAGSPPREIAAWLHVAADGTVTVYTGKVEFGQDIRTSLAQAVADELRAPLSAIRLVMGDTDLTPYDQGTFGSRTTPFMAAQLRQVAAAARETLLDLAAARWGIDRSSLDAREGEVVHAARGRALRFGELTQGQALVRAVAADPSPAPVSRWTVAGRSVPKVNAREIVTGRHRYTSDLTRAGLWHGRVVRPPAIGATLVSLDTSGVDPKRASVVHDGDFVGVSAPTAAEASLAAGRLKAQWKTSPQPSDGQIFEYLKKTPPETRDGDGRGAGAQVSGSVAEARAAAPIRLEQSYTVAYIAHAPLEPRAALAEWQDGKLTVWTGTQRPFGVRAELAEAFRLPEEKVRVIVPDTGAGYGGKHTGEAAIEAARLARAAGHPVKLVWTREEEFAWAYFRPAGVIDVKSGARADGTLTAWEFHTYNCGAAGIHTPYDVANQAIQFHPARSPLRQGSYRALAATANHFARETHMDEVARGAGVDALEMRRRNLKDARVRAVLDAAAERFGWPPTRTAGRGHGLAAGTEKGSYLATCAEVSIEPGGAVRVRRLVTAFECGAVVNPDHLRNQVEGAMVQGLGGALFEAVRFEDGLVTTDRFSRYRVPRFSDVPELDVVLVDRKDLPSAGAGETPLVCVAPAIGNAIFDATGTRLRSLPLVPTGVRVGRATSSSGPRCARRG